MATTALSRTAVQESTGGKTQVRTQCASSQLLQSESGMEGGSEMSVQEPSRTISLREEKRASWFASTWGPPCFTLLAENLLNNIYGFLKHQSSNLFLSVLSWQIAPLLCFSRDNNNWQRVIWRMLILITLLSEDGEGLVKAYSRLSEVIVFSEKWEASIYVSFTRIRSFLQRPLVPQSGLLAKNIFVVTFWHFLLRKIFVPRVLNVGLILPFTWV